MTGPDVALAALVALLDVEEIEPDLYRGARHPGGKGRVFGGQAIAQALVAASRSTPAGRIAHSLHANFMRPGDEDQPILFRVTRDFDGGSFSTRRVVASQRDRPILSLTASFQRPETGLAHADPMSDVPPPDGLTPVDITAGTLPPQLAHFLRRFAAFELRPVPMEGDNADGPRPALGYNWFRLLAPSPTDDTIRAAILAYVSDFGLLTKTTLPHGIRWFSGALQAASLDHALWLHALPPLDQWLLYAMDSPWAGGGRGLARGAIYDMAGARIATVAQEGLIRPTAPRRRLS